MLLTTSFIGGPNTLLHVMPEWHLIPRAVPRVHVISLLLTSSAALKKCLFRTCKRFLHSFLHCLVNAFHMFMVWSLLFRCSWTGHHFLNVHGLVILFTCSWSVYSFSHICGLSFFFKCSWTDHSFSHVHDMVIAFHMFMDWSSLFTCSWSDHYFHIFMDWSLLLICSGTVLCFVHSFRVFSWAACVKALWSVDVLLASWFVRTLKQCFVFGVRDRYVSGSRQVFVDIQWDS